MAGLTLMDRVVAPVLQTYDAAPAAVRVEKVPSQMVAGDAVVVTVGFGFTVTVTVAVFVQPRLVPVTV